ncbi:unnamed protein product, partial [Closterium sp. NIES-53]
MQKVVHSYLLALVVLGLASHTVATDWSSIAAKLDPGVQKLSSWQTNGDPCGSPTFQGVTCDGHHQPVALHLNGLGLAGEIPVEINQIATLTFLDLGRNTLSGVIPDSINNILSLQVLNLCNNRLGGRIPELNLVTKLFSLDLSRNQLGDAIPASLGLLTK